MGSVSLSDNKGAWFGPCSVEPGDGHVYVVMGRVVAGVEASLLGCSVGTVMLIVSHPRGVPAVMYVADNGACLAASYVVEKVGEGPTARVNSAFLAFAAELLGREPFGCGHGEHGSRSRLETPGQMGWPRDWPASLDRLKQGLADARVACGLHPQDVAWAAS